jgi:predicted transcriptional regulator
MKSLKVKDYMARRLITFNPTTHVVDAMDVFLKQKISGALTEILMSGSSLSTAST